MDRRQFLTITASSSTIAVAGCSGGSTSDNDGTRTPTDENTPTDTETTTKTDTDAGTETDESDSTETETADEVATSSGEPDDKVTDGVIETLADYEYVAKRPDEFVGIEISSDGGNGDIKYYNSYGENYEGFRALFDAGTRPFFFKTDEEFRNPETISFTGTIEKIGELQDTPVIFVENAQIERV